VEGYVLSETKEQDCTPSKSQRNRTSTTLGYYLTTERERRLIHLDRQDLLRDPLGRSGLKEGAAMAGSN
jgi:hypothetical protein